MNDEKNPVEPFLWRGFTFLSGACEAELNLAIQAELAPTEQQTQQSNKTQFPL